jgi:endoglucanase
VLRVTLPRPRRAVLPLLPALLALAALLAGPGLTPHSPAASAGGGEAAALLVDPGIGAPTNADNPLAGHPWGVYTGGAEMAWEPYVASSGPERRLLERIALQPKAKWFGAWIPDHRIAEKVREYVADATGGDPDVLVQLTVFRMVPWEQEACRRLPTWWERVSYRRWIDNFAEAVGDTRAAIVVQPDGPFAMCAPGGSKVLSSMVRYATKSFAALSRTTVYIEAGSAGWNHLDPEQAVRLLMRSGIDHARGFHLNTTHYEGTPRQVRFGARVVEALATRGIPDKHFTVDTAQNGRGFTWGYHRRRMPGRFDHAPVCRTRWQRRCVTLGIPPTVDVAAERWGLPAGVRELAARHVDAYLWAGRPWLYRQAKPFDRPRALQLARTTPYQR